MQHRESIGSGLVLLVEDDPMIRALTAEWVENAGFEVREAGSGREAIAVANEGDSYRAAILDVSLPDTDGHRLAQDLRCLRPGLPVLFATGDPSLLEGTVLAGPEPQILRKPYSTADLRCALNLLLAPVEI